MNVEVKRDGLTLRGELVVPEKDSYDIAILMHGFTGNRNGWVPSPFSHLQFPFRHLPPLHTRSGH